MKGLTQCGLRHTIFEKELVNQKREVNTLSAESGANRWWENYLVRYLMPSIAGMAIMNWLGSTAGEEFQALLLLPSEVSDIDAPVLTLLFLYGNLFCYIASYPVLSFHATRVLDFVDTKWPSRPLLDGYLVTSGLTIIAFIAALYLPSEYRYWTAFALAALFSSIQLSRLYMGLHDQILVAGLKGTVSPIFGFAYALARRRGVPEETTTTTSRPTTASSAPTGQDADDDEEEEEKIRKEKKRRIRWRPELIDTYRHLREHGNSAFIFLLELTLAALVYCVISKEGQLPYQQLSAVGILLAIWAIPSMFVHLVGQHLERRFSRYDNRL